MNAQQTVAFAIRNFQYTMVVYQILRNIVRLPYNSKNEKLMKEQRAFINDNFQLSGKSTRSLSDQEFLFQ